MDGVQEEGRDEEETGGRYKRGSLAAPTHNEATTRSAHIPSTTCATVSQTLGRAVTCALLFSGERWRTAGTWSIALTVLTKKCPTLGTWADN